MKRAFWTSFLLAAAVPAFALDVVVTPANAGQTVTLRPNDHLVVRLPSNQGTGFLWTILRNDPALLAPDSVHKAADPLPGGPATTTMVFDAVKQGKVDLAFQYIRPTGNGTSEFGKAFSLKVHIIAPNAPLVLKDGANGGTHAVRVGEAIEVRLQANKTTGYDWQLGPLPNGVLRKTGDNYIAPNGNMPGAGGVHVFRFTVAKRGQATIRLVYRRSWEGGVPPAKTWTYTFFTP